MCKLIPRSMLPTLPNTVQASFPEIAPQDSTLPLIVWSHGRGGNVHDHSLLLSQLAVESPALCVCITHTDGSADTWRNSKNRASFFRHSRTSGQDERYLTELVEMHEYQIRYRIRELQDTIKYLESLSGVKFGQVILGGFDLGGAIAMAAATSMNASGVITIDGMFSLEDRFQFPRPVFEKTEISIPVAFILSDEYHGWNKSITDNTKELMNRTKNNKFITVKQSKHNNFLESIIYWIPQVSLIVLRLSGLIHRRACPRKTYRRSVKWLVALTQQYMSTHSPILDK